MSIFTEKSGPPAWKQLPTWYQVSENDHNINPAVERLFAKQMNATTISLPSSHLSLLSHPTEVAQLILNATKGVAKGDPNESTSFTLTFDKAGTYNYYCLLHPWQKGKVVVQH